MIYLGDFIAGSTVRHMWNSVGAAGGSITRATNGSIRIYKNASTTQRASSSGITDSEDFDSLTGVHHLAIDLSDNADAGFYAAGSDYFIVLEGAVIDGQTVNAVLAGFSIENRRASINLSQTNTSETSATSLGGQIRRTHALTGGTVTNQDYSATNAPIVHRNEADSAALVTSTMTAPTTTTTKVTPT